MTIQKNSLYNTYTVSNKNFVCTSEDLSFAISRVYPKK